MLYRRPPIQWWHLPWLGDDDGPKKVTNIFFCHNQFFKSNFLLLLFSSIDASLYKVANENFVFFWWRNLDSMSLYVYISKIGANFWTTKSGRKWKKLSNAVTNYRDEFNVVAAISVDPNSMADIRKGSSYSHYILLLLRTFLATI